MTIGLGIVTYNRPHYFAQVAAAVTEHLLDVVDHVYVRNDGSSDEHTEAYDKAYGLLPPMLRLDDSAHNVGVGKSKNELMRWMLDEGCDWLFLSEDDIIPRGPEAITDYLKACEASGWQHLSFAHHGPANAGRPLRIDGLVTYWPNSVGAWCVYSAASIRGAGFMDERFLNSWEHVEHTQRLAQHGYTSEWPLNADATNSRWWLNEIPGSIEGSAIRHSEEWTANMRAGREYWRATKPDTYHKIWP